MKLKLPHFYDAAFKALGDEFQKLDQAYDLVNGYGITFVMFIEKPGYWRNWTELLHDGNGHRPPLRRQRIAALKADQEMRRRANDEAASSEPMRHHRIHRGKRQPFNRRLHP